MHLRSLPPPSMAIQLGIMTRMIRRPVLTEVADEIRASGLKAVQLNLTSAGLESLPSELDPATARAIGEVFASRGLAVAAVSGSFNTIHPDATARAEGIRRLGVLMSYCHLLGTRIVTLCTGTRDPENMWRHHPANSEPEAWRDLLESMRQLVVSADAYGVTIAFEPEVVNVVDTVAKARRLVEEVASPRLRVLIDPANLVRPEDLADTRAVLQTAFADVGPYIVLAHAKDVTFPAPGEAECRRVSAGTGLLDYTFYLQLLRASGFNGALILHDLEEREIPRCRRILESALAEATAKVSATQSD